VLSELLQPIRPKSALSGVKKELARVKQKAAVELPLSKEEAKRVGGPAQAAELWPCREAELSPCVPLYSPLMLTGFSWPFSAHPLPVSPLPAGCEGGCLRRDLERRGQVAAGGSAEPAGRAAGVPPEAGDCCGRPPGADDLGVEGGCWQGSVGAARPLLAVLGGMRGVQPAAEALGGCTLSLGSQK